MVAAATILLYSLDILGRFELLTLDYRFIFKQPHKISQEIVFIDMAEDSITAIGRWPWPRKWHAALIRALSEQGPRLIAFDVLFTEPQDKLDDVSFSESIRQADCVYLPVLYDMKIQEVEYLGKPGNILAIVESLEDFKKYLKGTGHLNTIPDQDGVLRRVPPFVAYEDRSTYQFGLKIGFDAMGIDGKNISFDGKRHAIFFKGNDGRMRKIPLDENNQFIINWQNKWGMEGRHYSYIDVIRSYAAIQEGKAPLIDLKEFKDKICIVGLTAAGLTDIKPVPIERAYPAVGINAMIVDNVLKDNFISEVPRPVNILIIILLAIFITLYLSNVRLLGGVLLAMVSMAGYFIFSVLLFKFFNLIILTFYPLVTIFLSYSVASVYAQVMQTIERSRLFKQATRDGLTGLYNIRHFNLLFEAEFRNVSLNASRRLAIIMADIDNFKHANDTYGHPAGDAILKEVAKVVKTVCRQTDVVARYGGEEFIVMLAGAGEKEASDVAEKIRGAVAEKKFRFGNTAYTTTISLGVAQFGADKNKDELIDKADKALYKAKRDGKNRVSVYSGNE